MNSSFVKALRYCWPYRGRVVLAWVCGLVGAALWAGSLSAVLPVFDLMFREPMKGVRFEEPRDRKSDEPRYILEAAPTWQVERDPEVKTFEVRGNTIRVTPDARVITPAAGLAGLAQKAHEEKRFYAPAIQALADLLPKDRYYSLLWIMVSIMCMAAVRGVLTFLSDYLVGHASNRAMLSLRLRVFDHVLRSPLTLYSRVGASDIISRFQQDCFLILEGMKTMLGKVVIEPPRMLLCLGFAIAVGVSIDPWLPVIVLVAAPLVGYLVRQLAKLMRRASRKSLESWANLMAILDESLYGIRVVKGYELEGHQRRRFFDGSRRLFRQILRAIRIDAVTNPMVDTIFTVAACGAVILGGKLIIDRNLTNIGELSLFFALLVGALDPVRKLANVSNRFQQGASGADRVYELLASDMEPRYGAKGTTLPPLAKSMEFRNVSFQYVPGKPVLDGINLTIRHGEVVAIIGRTGCGKTTLVSLLPRFFEPTGGEILIDGTNLRDVTLRSLRRQIAYVPQETVLFADTVATNIALGSAEGDRKRVPQETIEAAARQAHADAFIRQLPRGYETVLGEHGASISGGERQRLALARAITRDPAILILDEATSALDEETQALVQDTLRTFVKGRTTLLIAHRLSTLSIADRIVVMEAGRIAGIGTHDELMATCPQYQRLREVGLDSA